MALKLEHKINLNFYARHLGISWHWRNLTTTTLPGVHPPRCPPHPHQKNKFWLTFSALLFVMITNSYVARNNNCHENNNIVYIRKYKVTSNAWSVVDSSNGRAVASQSTFLTNSWSMGSNPCWILWKLKLSWSHIVYFKWYAAGSVRPHLHAPHTSTWQSAPSSKTWIQRIKRWRDPQNTVRWSQ